MKVHFFEAVEEDGRLLLQRLARILKNGPDLRLRLLRNCEQPERLLLIVETTDEAMLAAALPAAAEPSLRHWVFEEVEIPTELTEPEHATAAAAPAPSKPS